MKKKLIFFSTVFAVLASTGITSFAADATSVGDTFSMFFALIRQCPPVIVVFILSLVLIVLAVVFRKKISEFLRDSSASMMLNSFIVFFSVFGLACFALALATDGETWKNLLNGTDTPLDKYSHFSDYIKSLQYAGTKQFDMVADRLSPFGYLIFFLLAQFMPGSVFAADTASKYAQLHKNQTLIMLYLILVLFCIVLIYRMSRSKLRKNGISLRNEVVAFLLVVSYPTMYCISMGNIAGFAVAACLFFLEFYNSEKKAFRELAIIAIAVSAAIVPYTFVFAFLLLIDKSKMARLDFAQAAVFFSVLFVVPSIFTGFVNLLTYMKSLVVIPEVFVFGNGSIANLLSVTGAPDVLLYILTVITEVIALACVFILPNAWQKSAAAVYFILNLIPSVNSLTMIFVFIPLVYLLSEKKHKAIDWLYLLAFALLITPFPEWYYSCSDNFALALEILGFHDLRNANELIAPVAVQMIFVLIVCQSIAVLKAKKKEAVAANASEEKTA
ncbi:MAG: hypothetical protein IKV76_10220 [Clostridia bacterium]|nr:hypothetical protein [Clostridia bacterium]